MKYLIYDTTATDGNPFIGHHYENNSLEENAEFYPTKTAAENVIKLMCWENWAVVMEVEFDLDYIHDSLDYLHNMQLKRCCPIVQSKISIEIDKLIDLLIDDTSLDYTLCRNGKPIDNCTCC